MGIKFIRRHKTKSVIDMVPMIDIVFQLVIFFMVATTFKVTTGIELDMPKADYLSTISTTPLKITIKDKDNIFIEDKKTDINSFHYVFKKQVIKDSSIKKKVIIYGNKDIEYQLLIDVMDVLRIEGYESIDLAIKKKIE